MKRLGTINALAVAGTIAASVALAAKPAPPVAYSNARSAAVRPLIDATGAVFEIREFRRIASASAVADRLVLELCAPDRIVAFSRISGELPDGHRYEGRPRIDRIDDVEAIAELRPDLVLTHNVGDERRVARLRDVGLTVFDLGLLQGLPTLSEDARQVAQLCGDRARGDRFVQAFERRLHAIARGLSGRRDGLYLSVYGGQFFGGTRGTSYHDVLRYSGLRDVAAQRYADWPQYSTEAILALDPEVIVTRHGMRSALCGHADLERLRACNAGSVVEIDGALLDSPGPEILDAAEAVHAAVYGER